MGCDEMRREIARDLPKMWDMRFGLTDERTDVVWTNGWGCTSRSFMIDELRKVLVELPNSEKGKECTICIRVSKKKKKKKNTASHPSPFLRVAAIAISCTFSTQTPLVGEDEDGSVLSEEGRRIYFFPISSREVSHG